MKLAISGSFGIYLSWLVWRRYQDEKVTLSSLNKDFLKNVIENCPSITRYNPPPFYCGFLHTVIPTITKSKKQHTSIMEKIGETGISVDWIDKGESINSDEPLLFIIPGLTGKVQNGYVNSLITQANQYGFKNICIYSYRMLSPEANFHFIPPFQDYGLNMDKLVNEEQIFKDFSYFREDVLNNQTTRVDLAADMHYTLQYLKEKYKFKKILAIGCSYGGVQLGNYLGRFQQLSLINAGVTICSPHDITNCEKNISTIMDLTMTYILRRGLKVNKHLFDNQSNYPDLWQPNTNAAMKSLFVHQFDRHYTSQVYGYISEVEYYKHFSSINRFPNITIPMLCIASEDDFAVNIKAIGKEQLIQNGKTILCLTKAGGHIGFLEGYNADSTWFPKPALEFLQYNNK